VLRLEDENNKGEGDDVRSEIIEGKGGILKGKFVVLEEW
jgi:hypothetical protein